MATENKIFRKFGNMLVEEQQSTDQSNCTQTALGKDDCQCRLRRHDALKKQKQRSILSASLKQLGLTMI